MRTCIYIYETKCFQNLSDAVKSAYPLFVLHLWCCEVGMTCWVLGISVNLHSVCVNVIIISSVLGSCILIIIVIQISRYIV